MRIRSHLIGLAAVITACFLLTEGTSVTLGGGGRGMRGGSWGRGEGNRGGDSHDRSRDHFKRGDDHFRHGQFGRGFDRFRFNRGGLFIRGSWGPPNAALGYNYPYFTYGNLFYTYPYYSIPYGSIYGAWY